MINGDGAFDDLRTRISGHLGSRSVFTCWIQVHTVLLYCSLTSPAVLTACIESAVYLPTLIFRALASISLVACSVDYKIVSGARS